MLYIPVGAWVRGCVGAWVRGWVRVCVFACVYVSVWMPGSAGMCEGWQMNSCDVDKGRNGHQHRSI